MRSLRSVLWVVGGLACARTTNLFSTDVTPAFLGDASGIYQVASSDGVPLPTGATFAALEIRGQLVVVGQPNGTSATLAYVGPLVRDGLGGGTSVGTVTVIGTEGTGGAQFSFPVSADLTLGIDSLAVHGHDSPAASAQVPCFATSAGCGFSLVKLCDFDPQISGIFSVQVAAGSDNGQCAGHVPLAGTRQWAVATVNASPSTIVLSVSNDGLEFGSLLSLDLQSRALNNVLTVPLTADTSTEPVLDFTGSIALTATQVQIDASDIERSYPDGCVEHYTASGTRQQGVTFAIACPSNNGLDCFNNFSSCVQVPADFTDASYVLTAISQPTNQTGGSCPLQTCSTVVRGQDLCNDSQTRQIAAGGCMLGATPQSVAMTTQTSQNSNDNGGNNSCLALTCDPTVDCSKSDQNGNGSAPTLADFCPANSTVSLATINQTSCVTATCKSLSPECPIPDVSCLDYSGNNQEIFNLQTGCAYQGCLLSTSNGDDGGGGSGNGSKPSADLTQLDAASKALLLSGSYVISGTDAHGLPVVIQPPSSLSGNGGQNNGPNNGCGSAVDVDQLSYVCPASGTINSADEACMAPPQSQPPSTLQLIFYRGQGSNGQAPVCLSYWSSSNSQLLSISPEAKCSAGQGMCCTGPTGSNGLPPLGCGTNPAGTTPVVDMNVVATSSSHNYNFTILAPPFQVGNSNTNDANILSINTNGPTSISETMPLGAIVGGYALQLQLPTNCYFADPDLTTPGDYAATTGTLGNSDATAIALSTPLPASPVDINITCP